MGHGRERVARESDAFFSPGVLGANEWGAYSGDQTRRLAFDMGFTPVVPPLKSRVNPWEYDKELYKRRNEVERLFRRLKGYRRVFTRYDKLDALYAGFVLFAIIFDALRSVNRP